MLLHNIENSQRERLAKKISWRTEYEGDWYGGLKEMMKCESQHGKDKREQVQMEREGEEGDETMKIRGHVHK